MKRIVEIPRFGDHRYKSWAKVLSTVNTEKSNGYAFLGEFAPNGAKRELEDGTYVLLYGEAGSMKHHAPAVSLRVVDAAGLREVYAKYDLTPVGWALDVRDEIAAIVNVAPEPATVDRAALEAEKTALLARLAKIDRLLAQ